MPLFPFLKIELWKLSSGLLSTKAYLRDLLPRIWWKIWVAHLSRRHGNLFPNKWKNISRVNSVEKAGKKSLRNEKNEINQQRMKISLWLHKSHKRFDQINQVYSDFLRKLFQILCAIWSNRVTQEDLYLSLEEFWIEQFNQLKAPQVHQNEYKNK